MKADWQHIIKLFSQQKILVVGDSMVDAYMWGNIHRQSPEADVPIVDIQRYERRLGGAANVAKNIAALGAKPILCSVIGEEDQGFFKLLKNQNLFSEGIIQEKRKTTLKTRIICGDKHQLRVDEETNSPIQYEKAFIDNTILLMQEANAVILQDYNKGVLTKFVIKKIIEAAKEKNIPIAVDPKKNNFWSYTNIDLFKPNLKEMNESLQTNILGSNIQKIEKSAQKLQKKLNSKSVLVTLSENGIFYFDKIGIHQKAFQRKIIDVSGAGDSVIAAATLALACKTNSQELCTLANLAGGLVCEEVGVVPIKKEVLLKELMMD